jgi:hypothetical protein
MLPCQCSLLLGRAPMAAVMKAPWRLCRRGPGMGAAATAKGSQHGGGGSDDDGSLVEAAMMGSRRR